MRITDLTLTLFAWDGIPATSYGAHRGTFGGSSILGLLAIETDEGITGHAFLGAASNGADVDAAGLIQHLKPVVMGQDPLERERLNALLWRRGRPASVRALGAIDVALWDLCGKVANMPVYQMLGACRSRIGAYASSAVLTDPKAYAEDARRWQEAGWHAYKIHPPQEWRDDIRVCEAVREAVGERYPLMLDSTWAYSYETALRVGRAIENLGFHWFEDPLADQDLYNYTKLREKLDKWTGRRWIVALSKTPGERPIGEVRREREARELAALKQHPAVAAVLAVFPDAEISPVPPVARERDDDSKAG